MRHAALNARKQPTQRRSAATVDAIVEAAIRVLLSDGYGRLTTVRVAEVAGVSVGSLYQYFPNKQSIVAEVVTRRSREIFDAVARVHIAESAGLEAAVDALIEALLDEKQKRLALSVALSPAMAEVEGRRIIIEHARRFLPRLAATLSPVLERVLTPDEETRLAIAVAAVEGAVWEAIARNPERLPTPQLKATLSAIFLSGLKPAVTGRDAEPPAGIASGG